MRNHAGIEVAPNRTVELASLDPIDRGKVAIQHHRLVAHLENAKLINDRNGIFVGVDPPSLFELRGQVVGPESRVGATMSRVGHTATWRHAAQRDPQQPRTTSPGHAES